MNSTNKHKIVVMHILSSASIGGGERYLQDLIKYSNKSIRHLIILPYPGLFKKVLEDIKCHHIVIDMVKKFSALSILKLIKCINNNKVDIVHTHGYRANFYGRIVCLIRGVKNISTVHVSLYDYIDTPLTIRYAYILLEKILSYWTGIFICISNAMKRDMLKLGINPRKIVVIQNGVDLDRFYPRPAREKLKKELGITTNGPVIGTVGRMVTEKGQKYLIEALKCLKDEWKGLKCLFVGEGPKSSRLKKIAFDLGVEDMCIFLGVRKDIELIYPVLNIFVLPSLREPFGLVLLEAMASGIPVIATESGGPAEFIKSKINGILVPSRDPKGLASQINWLLSDKEKAQKIGKEGLKTVKKGFSVRNTTMRVEQIYHTLLLIQYWRKD